ncbi:MAG TPA: sensor histidine kinase [Solirubrobacteraceae bacterium]|nr:sensor histidine kinase [Solirubrobacteraceae bacterium]
MTNRSAIILGAPALVAVGAELALLLDDGSASAAAISLTVGSGGALALRRSQPIVVLAVTLAAAIGIVAVGETPAGLIPLIALYTAASACERRTSLAALVPTAAVLVGLSVADGATGDRSASSVAANAIAAGVLAAGVWALGAYTQSRRERAAGLAREREQRARMAVQHERTAIARELHDIVAHSVSVMLIGVRGAREVLRASPDEADDALARVETTGDQSLAELQRLLALMRTPADGIEQRPQPSLADLEALIAEYRDAGLPVRWEVRGVPRPLPGGVELSVYRIVQEALTNVLKHTRPTRVAVTLAFGSTRLDLEVTDDGASSDDRAGRGHGIVGMQERVALLGGKLETGRLEEGGFRVRARLPLGVGA